MGVASSPRLCRTSAGATPSGMSSQSGVPHPFRPGLAKGGSKPVPSPGDSDSFPTPPTVETVGHHLSRPRRWGCARIAKRASPALRDEIRKPTVSTVGRLGQEDRVPRARHKSVVKTKPCAVPGGTQISFSRHPRFNHPNPRTITPADANAASAGDPGKSGAGWGPR
jgi:hypothetical protein